MKIKDLMSRDVKTCCASDSVSSAARLMWENDCGVIPVVDEERRPIGMITDRDVCMAGYTTGKQLSDICVGDAMSRNVHTCLLDDPVGAAELSMQHWHVRRLPVVDSKRKLVGILSLSDLARGAARKDNSHDGDVVREQVAETLASVCEPWCSINARTANRASPRKCLVSVPVMAH